MLSLKLQIILISVCLIILLLFVRRVQKYKLELKYALIWIFTIVVSLVLAIFPTIVSFIAKLLDIKEPVNALFLVSILFTLVIVYSLTVALSKASTHIKSLSQELGLLKTEIDKITSIEKYIVEKKRISSNENED